MCEHNMTSNIFVNMTRNGTCIIRNITHMKYGSDTNKILQDLMKSFNSSDVEYMNIDFKYENHNNSVLASCLISFFNGVSYFLNDFNQDKMGQYTLFSLLSLFIVLCIFNKYFKLKNNPAGENEVFEVYSFTKKYVVKPFLKHIATFTIIEFFVLLTKNGGILKTWLAIYIFANYITAIFSIPKEFIDFINNF